MKKLRDLRPCDNCGGPTGFTFYIVHASLAVVKVQAVREYIGLGAMLGSTGLAEVMGAHQDDVLELMADQKDEDGNPHGWNEIYLCIECWCSDVNLAVLVEKRTRAIEKANV